MLAVGTREPVAGRSGIAERLDWLVAAARAARDERLHGMRVVIKFLLDTSSQSSWLAKKFLQEAEALTRINHPGVVRVIDRDRTEDGKPFFVMEFINGKSLRSIMVPEGIPLE